MNSQTHPSQRAAEGSHAAWRIVALYAGLAALWVLLSNSALGWWFDDVASLTLASTLKGWLFVLVTSVLLFVLVSRLSASFQRSLQALRQREAELQESHRLLQEAQQTAGLGSYEFDVEAGRWRTSAVADQLLGLDAHFVRNMDSWRKLVHPLDWDWVLAYFNREVLVKARAFTLEYRILRAADGAERWLSTTGEIDLDSQGRPQRLHGTMQDVTEHKRALAQVGEARNKLQATLDALPDLLLEVGQDGSIYQYHHNPHQSLQGLRGEAQGALSASFVGRRFHEVLPPQAAAVCRQAIDEALVKGFSSGLRYAVQSPKGERWFDLSVAPMATQRDTERGDRHFICIARDVTERKHAEKQLELAGLVFSHAREAIMVTDAQGLLVDVNEAFSRITGFSRREVLGHNVRLLGSGRHGKVFYQGMWAGLLQAGHWSGEVWNRHKDGAEYACLLSISTVRNEAGEVARFVALFSDITEQKRYQNQLETIAHFDALTGLPNRLLLTDRLQQAMAQAERRGQKVMLACLDLDGFQCVTDTHGKAVGDKLLRALGHRLSQQLREGDTLARLGGDAFVAILLDVKDSACESGAPQDAVPALIQRLIHAATEPFQIDGLVIGVSASVGSTSYPQALAVDAEQLLRQADQAMLQAKQAGKNRYQVFAAAASQSLAT